jgi:hypothetical protein
MEIIFSHKRVCFLFTKKNWNVYVKFISIACHERSSQRENIYLNYFYIYIFSIYRALSSNFLPEAARQSAASKDDVRDFMSVWPDIVRDLNIYAKQYESHFAPKYLT